MILYNPFVRQRTGKFDTLVTRNRQSMAIRRNWFCGLGLCALLGGTAQAEVALVGEVSISGESTDLSGLSGHFDNGIPHNQFGGISAIEHIAGDQYLLLPDRGPGDGAVPYATRFHLAKIQIPETKGGLSLQLTETHFLTKKSGQPLVGAANALQNGPEHPGRLDPEGMRLVRRMGQDPLLAISDEYGPRIDLYQMSGQRERKLKVPSHFEVEHAHHDPSIEMSQNHSGRQPNAGFEALAITPDSATLYTMGQRPLLQDGALVDGQQVGRLNRILRVNIASEATAEFVYVLDSPTQVVCELLCVDDHRALVLERDSLSGNASRFKRIALIDFTGASDVSGVKSLPSNPEDLPAEIKPVGKRAFIDLLNPRYGIAGEQCPAKFEGLTFGPDRQDGKKTLLVSVDNDFRPDQPTRILAFSISADEWGK